MQSKQCDKLNLVVSCFAHQTNFGEAFLCLLQTEHSPKCSLNGSSCCVLFIPRKTASSLTFIEWMSLQSIGILLKEALEDN